MSQHMNPLFSRQRFADRATETKVNIEREIRGRGRGLLSEDIQQLTSDFVNRYQYSAVILHDHNARVSGNIAEYTIPYSGDEGLLHYMPRTFSFNVPHADLRVNALHMYYDFRAGTEAVKASFESDLANLRQWLGWLTEEVIEFNDTLEDYVTSAIEQRKATLKQEMDAENELNS